VLTAAFRVIFQAHVGLAVRDETFIAIEITFIQTAAKYFGMRRRFARGLSPGTPRL